MRRKADDPRLPPECPGCKRREIVYSAPYGPWPTMRKGVCVICAEKRLRQLMADCKLRGAARTGWRMYVTGQPRPPAERFTPRMGFSGAARARWKGYRAAELFYAKA